jgi:hypothetical protein
MTDMAHSFCPHCCTIITDPAWRFFPSCGGRLPEAPGQERQIVPSVDFHRGIPALLFAAGLFLVLIVAAILVQAFALHFVPEPATADATALPFPSITPEVHG